MNEDTPARIVPWRATDPELVAETKVFRLYQKHATSPNDPERHADFWYLDAPDWVNIIALTPDDEVVVIEQYRHGIGEVTLEIPGGSVDPGEEPLAAGLRELREETGYGGDEARIIGVVTPNPAIIDNRCHTVLVRGAASAGPQELEGFEEIRVRTVPLAEIAGLIRAGTISHALVIAAFHHLDLLAGA